MHAHAQGLSTTGVADPCQTVSQNPTGKPKLIVSYTTAGIIVSFMAFILAAHDPIFVRTCSHPQQFACEPGFELQSLSDLKGSTYNNHFIKLCVQRFCTDW
jgi:hypothetical protein